MTRALHHRGARALSSLLLAVSACQDATPPSSRVTDASTVLGTRALGAATVASLAAEPVVIWRPPLGVGASSLPAQDVTVAASVVVCEWVAGACAGLPVAQFLTSSAGGARLHVDPQTGFAANWDLTSPALATRKTYRVRVMLNGAEVGALLVDATRGRWAPVDANGAAGPLVAATALPIRFLVVPPGNPLAQATIGAGGGQLTASIPSSASSGPAVVTVVVPPGAVSAPSAFRLTLVNQSVPGVSAAAVPLVPTFRLEPENVTFGAPVEVRVQLATPVPLTESDFPDQILSALHARAGDPTAERLGVRVSPDGRTLSATVTHFSIFAWIKRIVIMWPGSGGSRRLAMEWTAKPMAWYAGPSAVFDADMVRDALALWQAHTYGVTFVRVASRAAANLIVEDMPGDPRAVEPCPGRGVFTPPQDKPNAVLVGKACVPIDSLELRTLFNVLRLDGLQQIAVTINPLATRTRVQLVSTIAHEIGHALGFAHPDTSSTANSGDLMWWTANGVTDLTDADTLGLQRIYGLRDCTRSVARTGIPATQLPTLLALDDARCRATRATTMNAALSADLGVSLSQVLASYELDAPALTKRADVVWRQVETAFPVAAARRADDPDRIAAYLALKTLPRTRLPTDIP